MYSSTRMVGMYEDDTLNRENMYVVYGSMLKTCIDSFFGISLDGLDQECCLQ